MKGHFFHKNDIVARLENALNKTLGKVDVNNVFKKTKNKPKITGIAGNVIEQSVLGLSADNKQRTDLDIDGVNTELKTTGIRMSKKEKGKYETAMKLLELGAREDMIAEAVGHSVEEIKRWKNDMKRQ